MGTGELFFISIGLSMDAFAAAVCKGLSFGKINIRNSFIVALWFGGFQALMPVLGYSIGVHFKDYIISFDHWIAFFLLSFIGIGMIKESFSKNEDVSDDSLSIGKMALLAAATSIDALAMGISFAFLEINIIYAVLFIGTVTFILSFTGVNIGNLFGTRYKSKAQLAGGIILIISGLKILAEHI